MIVNNCQINSYQPQVVNYELNENNTAAFVTYQFLDGSSKQYQENFLLKSKPTHQLHEATPLTPWSFTTCTKKLLMAIAILPIVLAIYMGAIVIDTFSLPHFYFDSKKQEIWMEKNTKTAQLHDWLFKPYIDIHHQLTTKT